MIFLTTNAAKHRAVAALLAREAGIDVERRTATLPVPPSVAPAEVARFRALEAHRVFGTPVFAEALAIELADGLVSGASYRQAFEQPGGSSWLRKHDGASGVARIAVGFTRDGEHAQVFEAAIRGTLHVAPRGNGNAAWERHWVPDGQTATIAELSDAAREEALRDAPYLALARQVKAGP